MSAALRIVPDPAGDGADVLDEYKMFGHAAGWAETTIYARRRAVLHLAASVGARPEDVTPRQFVHWLATCKTLATRAMYYQQSRSLYG